MVKLLVTWAVAALLGVAGAVTAGFLQAESVAYAAEPAMVEPGPSSAEIVAAMARDCAAAGNVWRQSVDRHGVFNATCTPLLVEARQVLSKVRR